MAEQFRLDRPSNLPARRTRLIGRQADAAGVRDLILHADGRLVTLIGAGGVGKTSLALAVARSIVSEMPDGVWMVDLAPVRREADIAATCCAALGVLDQRRKAESVLVDHLAPRQTLLCLDNCEHLVRSVAALVDRLLDRAPDVRVVATSRIPLGVPGESVYLVPSLAAPQTDMESPVEIARVPAVQLFVERAHAASTGFALSARTAPAVAAICRRLDGIPLAIELAAREIDVFTPAEIEARLATRGAFADRASSGRPDRQQTIEATLDWSHALLDEPAVVLFRRLSVFSGSWTLGAAERVCAGQQGHTWVGAALRTLVEHSLVVRETDAGASRFRFLVPVAEYASAKLEESSEVDDIALAHARWVLELASRRTSGHFHATPEDLERIAADYGNCAAALRWAEHTQQATLAVGITLALLEYWGVRGLLRLGAQHLQAAVRLVGAQPTQPRAYLLIALAGHTLRLGDPAQARRLAHEAVGVSEAVGDIAGLRTALGTIGDIAADQGDYASARDAYGRARAYIDDTRDESALGFWSANMGGIALGEGSLVEAEVFLTEARRHLAASQPVWYLGHALLLLGSVARLRGDLDRAVSLLGECLHESGRYGAVFDQLRGLEEVARLASARDEPASAATLLGAASALRDATALSPGPSERRVLDETVNAVRVQLGARAFEAAWVEGRAMSIGNALRFATGPHKETPRPVRPANVDATAMLTPREHEVAALVAAGLSNQAIARHLAIAPGTARIHVERVRGKLGCTSRAQVAALVLRGALPEELRDPSSKS